MNLDKVHGRTIKKAVDEYVSERDAVLPARVPRNHPDYFKVWRTRKRILAANPNLNAREDGARLKMAKAPAPNPVAKYVAERAKKNRYQRAYRAQKKLEKLELVVLPKQRTWFQGLVCALAGIE